MYVQRDTAHRDTFLEPSKWQYAAMFNIHCCTHFVIEKLKVLNTIQSRIQTDGLIVCLVPEADRGSR